MDPPEAGKIDNVNQTEQFGQMKNVFQVSDGFSDDTFFHLTCHLDNALVTKIEKGEFVELEKLLPKDRKRKSEENRLEWVHHEGSTFLAPVSDRTNKINSFRRWEQAFRVYAMVYCGAQPNRAKEIWQYVSVINTASSSFSWENVYEYDNIFRHLMAFNPSRSWAVTYNQMWNLCMRDPLPSRNNFQNRSSFGASTFSGGGNSVRAGTSHTNNTGSSGGKKKKADYCWNFNKGITCKYGKKCRFVERCSYCDADSHGIVKCPKLEKDKKAGTY